jgi:hypothetical protein
MKMLDQLLQGEGVGTVMEDVEDDENGALHDEEVDDGVAGFDNYMAAPEPTLTVDSPVQAPWKDALNNQYVVGH